MPLLAIIAFTVWKIIDLVISYFAHRFHVFNPDFAFNFTLYHASPYIPPFLIPFANYDGAHYLHIAHDGYKQYEQAFFPLYPLAIHLFSNITGGRYFLPGLILANLAFLAGLIFFIKFLRHIGSQKHEILFATLFLLAFPTSFFFGAV